MWTHDFPVASQNTLTTGRQGRSTSENEVVHNTPRLEERHFLFILDDKGNKYPIPWKQDLEYTVYMLPNISWCRGANTFTQHFKSYVEEIYARNGDEDQLDRIRNGQFDATYDVVDGPHVILPSLWTDLVHEGMTVCISFGTRSLPRPTYLPPEGKAVEFVDIDVDVDVGHERRNEDDYNPRSSDEETSIQSDEDDSGDSEFGSRSRDEESEAQHVEPVNTTCQWGKDNCLPR